MRFMPSESTLAPRLGLCLDQHAPSIFFIGDLDESVEGGSQQEWENLIISTSINRARTQYGTRTRV